MPELAELRLSSDYVNEHTQNKTFTSTWKTPNHKCMEVVLPFKEFSIRTESRGKEFKMYITGSTGEVYTIMFGFGMTGGFQYTKRGEEPKFAHLQLFTDDGYTLSYVDPRRFGRWFWGDWKTDRSPDPTTEHKSFVTNIRQNLNKTAFDKPIYELLMNQKYCNGIGNYLRAEILGRIDSNPFTTAREYITNNPKVLDLCKEIPEMSYKYKSKHGYYVGNEPYLKYYKNPKSLNITDKGKRVFWYDSKWGEK